MSNDNYCVVSTDEALAYLGIDYADDMVAKNVERNIKAADVYLIGSIGENYPVDDPRAKELALMIVADLYESRGTQSTISGNTRKIVDDLSLQLRMELRRASDGI